MYSALSTFKVLTLGMLATVIPGATRPDQATANASASDCPPLSSTVHEHLRTFYRERVASHIRGAY